MSVIPLASPRISACLVVRDEEAVIERCLILSLDADEFQNALSPILAVPNGMAHFVLTLPAHPRESARIRLRLALSQGLHATILQPYVARFTYSDCGAVRRARGRYVPTPEAQP